MIRNFKTRLVLVKFNFGGKRLTGKTGPLQEYGSFISRKFPGNRTRVFLEYFHTTENISVLWNWTKLWKLDFSNFFYNISKIFKLEMICARLSHIFWGVSFWFWLWFSADVPILELTTCQLDRIRALSLLSESAYGVFVPECKDDGSFKPQQCHQAIGQCWCVDSNGNELWATRSLGSSVVCPPKGVLFYSNCISWKYCVFFEIRSWNWFLAFLSILLLRFLWSESLASKHFHFCLVRFLEFISSSELFKLVRNI